MDRLRRLGRRFHSRRDSIPTAKHLWPSIPRDAGSSRWWPIATINSNSFPLLATVTAPSATWATAPACSTRNATAILYCQRLPLIRREKIFSFPAILWGAATFEGIQVYGINQTTGVLERVNSFATQHLFEALSSDRQGWRVFAVSEETNLVEPFAFNRNVDAIQLLNGGILYHTGSQPNGVAIDPSNRFVYVTNGRFCCPKQIANGNCKNTSSGNISGYAFNYTRGTLTNLAGFHSSHAEFHCVLPVLSPK